MDFTVITANLDHGRFLGDCLASVADQPGVTLEHLVIDGGSTDDSAAVTARFPHATWSQGPDKGMSDAINKGFDRAQGDWVIWLNADDRLKPGILAKVKQAAASTSADILFGDYDFIDEAGTFIRSIRVPSWSPFVSVHHCCYIGSTACFLRRATVIAPGHRLREDFHYVMDGELYARLHAGGLNFDRLPLDIADFRQHGGNASLRHLGKSRDLAVILKAERQHVESRAIRRAYGLTLFEDPYLNGLVDGILWIAAKGWKVILK
ncbi:glycosyltransferase [Luteolibacter sp. Populi]|uniref:glycosyltransferase n=1 Tax=Luteolibacter sp. Populi TaxID=3230487 RepID=UPI003465B4AD